jgi:hypothetical protein
VEVAPHDVQRLPDDELGAHLLVGFGVTATAVEPVTGGTEVRVWRVGSDDGRTWAARWSLAGVPVGQHVAARPCRRARQTAAWAIPAQGAR